MANSTVSALQRTLQHTAKQIDPKKSSGSSAWLLAAVAGLAAAAAFVQYRTRKTEADNPPVGKFIDVDGVRLHYVERGEGPPLVLLHGNGTMLQDFDISGVLDMASNNYRVIVFDRPGYGYSERPRGTVWSADAQAKLLHKALQQFDVQRPIVVGHSWGTLVAVALALQYPAYVRSLVLLSGYYYPTLRLDAPLLSTPAIPVLGDLMRYTVSPLLSRLMWPLFLRKLFGPAQAPQRFARFPVWMALRPSQLRASAAESALMIPVAIELRRRYHELAMPVTIMAGKDDRLVKSRQSAQLHDELPLSDLRMVPGAGHMIHHLAPHDVMEAIESAAQASLGPPSRMRDEHFASHHSTPQRYQ